MSWPPHNPRRTDSSRCISVRWAVAVGITSMLAGACVAPNPPGVAVEPLNADIVFGVEEIAKREADPMPVAPDVEAVAVETDDDLLPDQLFTKPEVRNFPRPQLRAEGRSSVQCPDALLNAFPAETAPAEVPEGRLPKEGVYRWKRDAKVTLPSEFGPIDTNRVGLEERLVRNLTMSPVQDPADEARRIYTYEVVQPELGTSDVAIMTYKVDTNAPGVQAFNPVAAENPPPVGDPERGVVLKSVRYEDQNGNRRLRAFNPTTGLLIMPLGVLPGQSYTSVAVDPATQQTWQLDAVVQERDRVDACGEIIEGWRVGGTLTITGDNGGTRKASWIVAPQLGGMVIGESYEGDYGDQKVVYKANVGQLEPSPPATDAEEGV